jgi:hypothetical protein
MDKQNSVKTSPSNEPSGTSPASLASVLGVSTQTVYRWIGDGKLKVDGEKGKYDIPTRENTDFIGKQLDKKTRRYLTTTWMPKQLKEYSQWHEFLDELAWLFKISYSSRQDIRQKRFRLDQLFANYIQTHKVTLRKVKQAFGSNNNPNHRLVTDDLKRGWYNELSYAFPLKKSTLGISFRDISTNMETSDIRYAFPSWKIIEAYYSVYFYLRAVTLQKQSGFRIQEHGATISSFKHNVLQPLENVIWKFPLDIAYSSDKRIQKTFSFLDSLPHIRHHYCSHPRFPHRTPKQIIAHMQKILHTKSKRSRSSKYTLFDFLHDLRVWANYLDIDNLLSLWGQGYKSFIDQNLSLILFFIGGVSEICFMAVVGPKNYVRQLQKFYDLFATNNSALQSEFPNTAIYQRLQIYNHLGLCHDSIDLREIPDVNQVRLG